MVQYIKVNGEVRLDMDLVFKYGQMELVMKEIGKTIRHMELGNSGM